MTTTRLAKGKKRYYVTLTEENVELIKASFVKNKLPQTEFSVIVDMFCSGIAEIVREMEKQKGGVTVGQIIDAVRRAGCIE